MNGNTISLTALHGLSDATAGQDVLRYIGLPTLLGEEKDTILYFFGRNLARQFEIDEVEDMYYIFQKLKWGNLEVVKEKRNRVTLYLMADEVVQRIESSIDAEFRIEAGFIAEVFQKIFQRGTECIEELNKKLYRVEFTVHFTD
ncbi:MAG TPA: DUF2507 domain-containing protein [Pseudogracilibacillus sp.]|nr:DUF2507 domain-containing protein [Pseudogracilibacillus sp.]